MHLLGIGEAIGGVVGGALSYKGAREANKMNQKIAREQMSFQQASNRANGFSGEDVKYILSKSGSGYGSGWN